MKKMAVTFHEGSLRGGNKTFEAPGDIMAGNPLWVRYEDEDTRAFKLNVERNNGRAALTVFVRVVSGIELWPRVSFQIEVVNSRRNRRLKFVSRVSYVQPLIRRILSRLYILFCTV